MTMLSDAPPTTTVVAAEPLAAERPERRRRIGGLRSTDGLALGGALLAALSTTWILFNQLAPFSGPFGFVVLLYALFLAYYAGIVSFDEKGPAVRDRVAATAVHTIAVILLSVLVFVIGYTLWRGWTALVNSNFFTEDLSNAGPHGATEAMFDSPLDPRTADYVHGRFG